MSKRWGIGLGLWLLLLLGAGFFVGSKMSNAKSSSEPVEIRTYSSGLHDQAFFDHAYDKAQGIHIDGIQSMLVAHHLLIADAIAEDFEDAAHDDVKTVVLVSPNHFGVGKSSAQVSFGQYSTPYGTVETDVDAAQRLIDADAVLKHEEAAFSNEHGIYSLTPFVKKSFPNAKIIPIIMYDTTAPADAYALGQTIAQEFPDALLVASVDMTHYEPADYTAENDQKVLDRISDNWLCNGAVCGDGLDIDSNASMRVLFGFNSVRNASTFHLTRHDSSLEMGATTDYHENTSHILGYFTK